LFIRVQRQKESCSNVFLNYVNFITRHSTQPPRPFDILLAPQVGERIPSAQVLSRSEIKILVPKMLKKRREKPLNSVFEVWRARFSDFITISFHFLSAFPCNCLSSVAWLLFKHQTYWRPSNWP